MLSEKYCRCGYLLCIGIIILATAPTGASAALLTDASFGKIDSLTAGRLDSVTISNLIALEQPSIAEVYQLTGGKLDSSTTEALWSTLRQQVKEENLRLLEDENAKLAAEISEVEQLSEAIDSKLESYVTVRYDQLQALVDNTHRLDSLNVLIGDLIAEYEAKDKVTEQEVKNLNEIITNLKAKEQIYAGLETEYEERIAKLERRLKVERTKKGLYKALSFGAGAVLLIMSGIVIADRI